MPCSWTFSALSQNNHRSVLPAGQDHAEFAREADQPFKDHGLPGQSHAFGLVIIADPPLALAVIALAPGLEDAGRSDPDQRLVQVFAGVDRHIGRGAAAPRLDEFLLVQPVLRHFQRARIGVQRHGAQRFQRCNRNILELIGHHRTVGGEFGHGAGIGPLGMGETGADLGRNRIRLGRIDVDAVTQLRGGLGQHPSQLPAAQNADGFAGWDHHGAQLGRSATPALCAAR